MGSSFALGTLACVTWCLSAVVAIAAAAESADGGQLSPARRRIASAEQRIARDSGSPVGYVALASALAELARETANPSHYRSAQHAVEAALWRAPEDPAARRLAVWILLGQHDFARARERAEVLRKRAPDDIAVYPLLMDAYVELGEYALAEEAAQRMLDLRPDYVPGLARAAYLRELFGDLEGSLELLQASLQQTPETESEQRAWYLAHESHVQRLMGQLDDAARSAEAALETLPDYHYALAVLAEAREDQGRLEEALALARRHVEVAPHPENRLRVGQLLARTGRADEAAAAFAEFEAGARAESEKTDNANRELAFYLADEGHDPEAALRVAERERARRRDVFTLEAHAWALHRNGRNDEARAEIESALAIGVRDPRLFYHAGAIAIAQDDDAAARGWLEAAETQVPGSRWSELARAELGASSPPLRWYAVGVAAAVAFVAAFGRRLELPADQIFRSRPSQYGSRSSRL